MTQGERTKADIEADIAAARTRLSEGIEALIMQVHPKAIVHNTVSDARALLDGGVRQVRSGFVAEDGSVRTRRVVLVAAALAGGVAFLAVVRSLVRR